MPSLTKKYNFDELKSACRDLIERELGEPTDRGSAYDKYICPFHDESTPSFTVYDDHYFCYGCGTSGDTVDFIQKRYRMTTSQAVAYLNGGTLSVEEADEYKKRREAKRLADAAKLEQARSQFAQTRVWEQFHETRGEWARREWEKAGFSEQFQQRWQLGGVAEKHYEYRDQILTSPALTIPYSTFVNGKPPEIYTVQYRLLNPVNPKDKYRFEKDLGSGPWIARPDLHPGEKLKTLWIGEGMKKAGLVSIVTLDAMQCIGAVSKTALSGLVQIAKQFDEVYVCMDPDVVVKPKNAASDWRPPDEVFCSLVPQARYIRYPRKIDDAILQYGLSNESIFNMMRYNSRR